MTRLWCWITRRYPRSDSTGESVEAHKRAEHARESAEKRWPEVQEVTVSLSRLRKKNHFIEGFRRTL